ncbi:MAG: alpha/beta fold hydrolase [Chloroflexi bacterium]|nr:alpha/beta fold hydrolase [Chloroflexota bacterium]
MRLRPATRRLRLAWRAHLGLAFGFMGTGLVTLVALTLLIDRDMVPACEAVTPAPPNFDVAPFAFDPEARALTFAQALLDEDYRSAYAMLAPEVQSTASICSLPLEDLRSMAEDFSSVALDETVGGSAHAARTMRGDVGHTAAYGFLPFSDELEVWLKFERRQPTTLPPAIAKVVLVRDGRVSRFWFHRALSTVGQLQDFQAPPYADRTAFNEIPVVIGEAPWELGGTLTLPVGPGPFPAVVVVPGSGYADRDFTGLASKASRDLAWGLASQGVAVLRYDKRTLTHALAFARQPDFTLDDELVDDALAAVALLRQKSQIDPARVFVLGSSLGGWAAPRIALRHPTIAGLILYSAPAESRREQLLHGLRQLIRDASRVATSRQEGRWLDLMRDYAAAVAGSDGAPLHVRIRPGYPLERDGYRAEVAAQDVHMPFLILHGALDRAVTRERMSGWITSLRGRDDVVFRRYVNHDHGLFDWRDRSGPDLRPANHVSAEVVDDIVRWIAGERPDRECVDIWAWNEGCRGGPGAEFRGVASAQ